MLCVARRGRWGREARGRGSARLPGSVLQATGDPVGDRHLSLLLRYTSSCPSTSRCKGSTASSRSSRSPRSKGNPRMRRPLRRLLRNTLTRRMSGRTLARERESIKNEEGVGLSRFPLHADSPVAPSQRIVPAYTGLGYAESAPYLLLGGAPDVLLLAEEPVNGDPDEGVLRDPLAPPRRLAPVDAAGQRRQRIHLVAPQARLLAFEREVLRDPRRRRHGLIAALLPCGGFHGGPSPASWPALGHLLPRSCRRPLAVSSLTPAFLRCSPYLVYEVGQTPPAPPAHQTFTLSRSPSNWPATRL